jgi:hypothetical protein
MRGYEASVKMHYDLNQNIKLLKEHRARLEKIPNIKKYLESDRAYDMFSTV